MDLIRDEMVATIGGEHPQLNFADGAEVIVAFAISVRGGATLPAMPRMIDNLSSADRLADLVFNELEAQREDPDRLAFLFSTVSSIHVAAPDWFNSEEYLEAIWAQIVETWPDLRTAPLGPENRRDWHADTDIILLRRVGLSQTEALPDAGGKHRIIHKILRDIAHHHGFIAPFANALRTINALKRRNIHWPEFSAIEQGMRATLREKPSLAGVEFVDI